MLEDISLFWHATYKSFLNKICYLGECKSVCLNLVSFAVFIN